MGDLTQSDSDTIDLSLCTLENRAELLTIIENLITIEKEDYHANKVEKLKDALTLINALSDKDPSVWTSYEKMAFSRKFKRYRNILALKKQESLQKLLVQEELLKKQQQTALPGVDPKDEAQTIQYIKGTLLRHIANKKFTTNELWELYFASMVATNLSVIAKNKGVSILATILKQNNVEENIFLAASILYELSEQEENLKEFVSLAIISTLNKIVKATQSCKLKLLAKLIASQLVEEKPLGPIQDLGGRSGIVSALKGTPEEKTAMLKKIKGLARQDEEIAKILVKPDILNQVKHLLLQKQQEVQCLACGFLKHLAVYQKCKKRLLEGDLMAPLVLLIASEDPIKKKARSALIQLAEGHRYSPPMVRLLVSNHSHIAALAEYVLIASPILYTKIVPDKEDTPDPLQLIADDVGDYRRNIYTGGRRNFLYYFRKALHKHHAEENHPGIDEMTFLSNLNLGQLVVTDILNCSDDQLYNYLPLIAKLMRLQTDIVNSKDTLQTSYYTKNWCQTVDALLYRIHINPDVGQLLSWLENIGQGIAAHTVADHKRRYHIRIAYRSQALRDTQHLFNFLATHRVSLGQEKGYTISKILILDPVTRHYKNPGFSRRIMVQKVFRSKAAPILTTIFHDDPVRSPTNLIFKKGEDLSRDLCVQTLFAMFNKIWELAPLDPENRPYLEMYCVLPVGIHGGEGIGVIQAVKSVAVYDYDWSKLEGLARGLRKDFLRSVAGAFVAGHILTLRDRHMHNMLVKEGNGCYLQIDFEHVFDPKSSLGPPVSIHPQMRAILQQLDEWNVFLTLCVEAFMILRNFASMITHFCVLLFESSVPNGTTLIPKLLSDAFMLGYSNAICRAQFREIFDRAPDAVSYKLKSWVHMFGQKYVPTQELQSSESDEMKFVLRAQALGLTTGLGTHGTARKYLTRSKTMPTLSLPPELQFKATPKKIPTSSEPSTVDLKKQNRRSARPAFRHDELTNKDVVPTDDSVVHTKHHHHLHPTTHQHTKEFREQWKRWSSSPDIDPLGVPTTEPPAGEAPVLQVTIPSVPVYVLPEETDTIVPLKPKEELGSRRAGLVGKGNQKARPKSIQSPSRISVSPRKQQKRKSARRVGDEIDKKPKENKDTKKKEDVKS